MAPRTPEDFRLRGDLGDLLEVLIARIYAGVVEAGDWVIDGGACGGLHTLPLAKLAGETGRVLAYDANSIAELEEWMTRAGFAGNVVFRQAALSNRRGRAPFYRNIEQSALSSLARPLNTQGYARHLVNLVKLDDEVIPGRLSFIKLDLEGGEFNCLQGSERLLRDHSPLIVFENGREWPATQFRYTRDEFLEFFARNDYALADLFGRPLTLDTWEETSLVWYFAATKIPTQLSEIGRIAAELRREIEIKDFKFTEWREVVACVANLGKLPARPLGGA